MTRNLLLISNSTNVGEAYLGWPREHIKNFMEGKAKRILFIPYAGVGLSPDNDIQKSYDIYEERVAAVYAELGLELYSIHKQADPVKAVEEAEAIAVGGGNTFHLVHMIHKNKLVEPIQKRVAEGMAYMGWSAGSNLACPSLKTTNDMPIIEPASFNGLNLIPFQINPHYLDAHPDGHGGETREQRLEEFMVVNPDMYIAGLREACLFIVEDDNITHVGERSLRVFKGGQEPKEYQSSEDINFLMK